MTYHYVIIGSAYGGRIATSEDPADQVVRIDDEEFHLGTVVLFGTQVDVLLWNELATADVRMEMIKALLAPELADLVLSANRGVKGGDGDAHVDADVGAGGALRDDRCDAGHGDRAGGGVRPDDRAGDGPDDSD